MYKITMAEHFKLSFRYVECRIIRSEGCEYEKVFNIVNCNDIYAAGIC